MLIADSPASTDPDAMSIRAGNRRIFKGALMHSRNASSAWPDTRSMKQLFGSSPIAKATPNGKDGIAGVLALDSSADRTFMNVLQTPPEELVERIKKQNSKTSVAGFF